MHGAARLGLTGGVLASDGGQEVSRAVQDRQPVEGSHKRFGLRCVAGVDRERRGEVRGRGSVARRFSMTKEWDWKTARLPLSQFPKTYQGGWLMAWEGNVSIEFDAERMAKVLTVSCVSCCRWKGGKVTKNVVYGCAGVRAVPTPAANQPPALFRLPVQCILS